jgi:hypothetical protein
VRRRRYSIRVGHNVIPQIGGIKVKELTADQLDDWLDERAEELSTRGGACAAALIKYGSIRQRNAAWRGGVAGGTKEGPEQAARSVGVRWVIVCCALAGL